MDFYISLMQKKKERKPLKRGNVSGCWQSQFHIMTQGCRLHQSGLSSIIHNAEFFSTWPQWWIHWSSFHKLILFLERKQDQGVKSLTQNWYALIFNSVNWNLITLNFKGGWQPSALLGRDGKPKSGEQAAICAKHLK